MKNTTFAVVVVVVAGATFTVIRLLDNIRERKVEARESVLRIAGGRGLAEDDVALRLGQHAVALGMQVESRAAIPADQQPGEVAVGAGGAALGRRIPADQRNRRAEKSRSDYDIAHRFVLSYTYELPFGRNSTGIGRILADGWQFIGIHSFNTGNPYTVSARTNFSNAGGDTRPDLIPDISLEPPAGRRREQWFNPAAFRDTTPGLWGNAGRNIDSLPGTTSIDFGL